MLGWMKHQLGIKIAGRNINNLRYADDTTLMAESEEELKSRSKRQRINLKNIQATPPAQLQKNKWPNQKMGQRTK